MTENYKIITNEEAFESFIQWLPDLQDNEMFYASLFARKKYCPELIKSNDKTQLKRFTSRKDWLHNKVRQLEIPFGRWKLREQTAPQESLVLYIMPNPRDMKKATYRMIKKCVDVLETQATNYNIQAEALSAIQKSKSRSCFVDFDLDTKEFHWETVFNHVNPEAVSIIETRGGYHILIQPDRVADEFKKTWHKGIREEYGEYIDNVGDMMIPVVGCTQGGLTPKFVYGASLR